ncbi:MAG: zinc ABC transporter substrate-binding protein [Nitriliruptor sp.]|nr:MAG: zinc ABC transporter substrate-binding protein [Nitriliruptor sp.]
MAPAPRIRSRSTAGVRRLGRGDHAGRGHAGRGGAGRGGAGGGVLMAFAALVVLLAACGGAADPAQDGDATEVDAQGPTTDERDAAAAAAEDEQSEDDTEVAVEPVLHVVATVAPVADLVVQVGGDRVVVDTLVPAGADAHTYEPRPSDVITLAGADAYLGIGLDLNGGALRMAEEHLPSGSPLILLGETALDDEDIVFDHTHDHGHSHGDDDHGHSHGDDHGHSHDDGDDELGPNPHVWTSLANTRRLIGGITAALTELDPDGASAYAANADGFLDELDDLDAAVREAVGTITAENRTLVTYHDAWTYFARDYDLDYATAVQPADFSDPSASEVRAVIDLVRELQVPAVFGSQEFPTPVLEAIAEETGARYVDDLADDVLPGEPGAAEHTYLELMRRNARAIVDGLGGDPSGLG